MKVVAFNGSPRPNGNTFILINHVFDELKKHNIETELVQLGGQEIRGCIACYKCMENKNNKCIMSKDIVNDCIAKMIDADGIIFGSPTYFSNVTSEIKALIDRSGLVAGANGNFLRRKVGVAVIAVRRAGSTDAFDAINKLFLKSQMIVPGSTYWNMGIGRGIGEVSDDLEGIATMKVLGENMAWLLHKLHA